ncbi:pseudouridine synthase [Exilibacterium tricleocarpae]|uniref:Pseudouridine synthase n=1 Tax=Exilibacterium tricleocarpae TaxID=2591008 RepID=A0A545T8J0_9GAMM|nr:pseudouridine synthase [Exilibacterium tricleocarpae]TQV73540.1 pseudouridine synthase [Exilibacterium tricleocarpae]
MARLILFNKPFGVLSQFSDSGKRATLADYITLSQVYPAGRLDRDSEGLLLLTDEGKLQHRISHPDHKLPKTYWVQVEGVAGAEAVEQLRRGVTLKDGPARAVQAAIMPPPSVWGRTPPIRQRRHIPTSWLRLTLTEGRNRQVRRMTAAVGLPTLRLIRVAIGDWQLGELQPGQWRQLPVHLSARRGPQHTHSRRREVKSPRRRP